MKSSGALLVIMGILSFFSSTTEAAVEDDFWKWFNKNQEMIFHFENDTERTFDKLSAALSKVDPELTFEFSPILENGKREFVISAGGIKSAFPSVEKLANSAPDLEKWTIVKFRPRRLPLNDLNYGGVSVRADDVYYNLYKDGEKLGVVLFFDDYNEEQHTVYGNMAYLFLDEALGEYDVETKLGFIEFHRKSSEYFKHAKQLKHLASQVDEYFSGL
jgi:hypothetical protein